MPLVAKPRQKRGSAPRACLRQMTGISRNRALCKPGVPSAQRACGTADAATLRRRRGISSSCSHSWLESQHTWLKLAPNLARSRPLWACVWLVRRFAQAKPERGHKRPSKGRARACSSDFAKQSRSPSGAEVAGCGNCPDRGPRCPAPRLSSVHAPRHPPPTCARFIPAMEGNIA
jgi:hypothetical protein